MTDGSNPYRAFVAALAAATSAAERFVPAGLSPPPVAPPAADAGTALILAPHPDDECLVGALPLRLRRAGMRVVDVAITLGSNLARRGPRAIELAGACAYLGFERRLLGLERVHPSTRHDEPAVWAAAIETLATVIDEERPRVIFFPHEHDWNPTHVGTHLLARDGLARLGHEQRVIETEYWGAMATPNLMVESTVDDVADLVAATSFHAGEVERNPYHVRLPAWLQDNVRRGGELVGGVRGRPPAFAFATLYRIGEARGGVIESAPPSFLAATDDPFLLLR